ncbi:MAG: hypothetical protein IJ508_05115, partial [Oscillospiraceae bacterium]|nr:hypothetical protein [Oscillospiraceae bacterium]
FTRWCEIDEPFMLRFEDGDILELDTPMEPFFKIDMNSGEWHKDSDRNNLILNDFFDVCIDKRIVEVEVKTYRTDSPPVWYWFDDDYEQGKEQDWIGAVILWLDNGIGLEITGEIDYTCIACIHHNGEPITIPFSKLKKALCNQEDLYEDTYIGFETKDRALLCGTNGYRKAEAPWITISDTCRGSRMCINEEDFAIFADGFYRVTGDYFDIYGDYELTYSMWMEILKKSLEICEKKNSNTEEDEKLIFRINELIRWSKAVHTLTGKIMLNGF